jgi:hypothetical protein
MGEYVLTHEDVLSAREFDDVIARATYPVDIHNPEGRGTLLKKIAAGRAYDIPLRCLIPQKVDNLLVAGRCISGTHQAQSSFRVMAICMATGQAAGVCAAVAAETGGIPRNVDPRKVQKLLGMQNADIRGLGDGA